MLDKLIFLVALAGTAVVYADVLVREGMLLQPVQRWLREQHLQRFIHLAVRKWKGVYSDELATIRGATNAYYECLYDLDNRWWWKPLWGCYKCVVGQWGFWGYLIRYHHDYTWRTVPEHLAFTAFTILAAIIIHKWIQD